MSQGDSAAAKPIMPIGQGEYFGYSNDVAPGDVAAFRLSPGARTATRGSACGNIIRSFISTFGMSMPLRGRPRQFNRRLESRPAPASPRIFRTRLTRPPLSRTVCRNRLEVTLSVYDILGREVAVMHEKKTPGTYEVKFDGSGLPSGVYFYRLQAGGFMATRKLILLR